MNIKAYLALTICVLIAGGCTKSTTTNDQQSPPPTHLTNGQQALPPTHLTNEFQGKVYRSLSGNGLKLISKDECEITADGVTIQGQYTQQDNALRVVIPTLEAKRVIYFTCNDKGLEDANGVTYFSSDNYIVQMRMLEEQADQHGEQVRKEKAMINDGRSIGSAAQQYFLESGKTVVAFDIDSEGAMSGPLAAYVNRVTKGTQVIAGQIDSNNGTFSLRSPDGKVYKFSSGGERLQ